MIDAFKSTLEELNHTDIIVIVIDISDSVLELKKKFSSCMRTLSDLDIKDEKMIYVLNKSDLVKTEEINRKIDLLNLTEQNNWIEVSSKTGNNIKELKELIKNIIDNNDPQKFKMNTSSGGATFGN
jgi:GTP-binding protein HflX